MATNDVFRTMIVPVDHVDLARDIAVTMAPVAGARMWITGLAPTEEDPTTHYVSTGFIGPEWNLLMPVQEWQLVDGTWTMPWSLPGNPEQLHGALQQAGSSITLAQINSLFQAADVTTQEPEVAYQRLGLVLKGMIDGL